MKFFYLFFYGATLCIYLNFVGLAMAFKFNHFWMPLAKEALNMFGRIIIDFFDFSLYTEYNQFNRVF
jgi:hypothetical protein